MRYVLFYKPYHVLSQFSGEPRHETLSFFDLPKNIYSVGRLDKDSEGLLLLTDDGKLKHRLTEPSYAHQKVYLAQVEGSPSAKALAAMRNGITLDGKPTRPTTIRVLTREPAIPERVPPIRVRKTIPTTWLEIGLTEGRNRQIRRMTAAVGHPTLRLLRIRILFLSLDGLQPGIWRNLTSEELRKLKELLHL